MRADMFGTMITVTELAYSYVDSPKEGSCIYLLRGFGGLPFIPCRLIRGCFRHKGFYHIVRKLKKLGILLSLDDWRLNLNGSIRQGGDFDFNLIGDRPKFEQHPYIGPWGCMQPITHQGKIQIENAIPRHTFTPIIIPGQRSDDVQRGGIARSDVADPDNFDSYIASLTVNREDRQERAKRAAARRKGEKPAAEDATEEGPRVMSVNLPHSRECIPRGVTFDHHISLRNVNDVQLGLFLMTLEEFSKDPFIGAQLGMNAGIVDMHYKVLIDRQPVGEIKIDGRMGTIEMGNLREFVDLFWTKFSDMDFSNPLTKKP